MMSNNGGGTFESRQTLSPSRGGGMRGGGEGVWQPSLGFTDFIYKIKLRAI
jgi:hypothetical protein